MNETSTANIKQILTAFANITAIHENPQWVKTATTEDIKTAFKLGRFVETTMSKFGAQNCLPQFLKILTNNKPIDYDQEFYSKACDHLLVKFFKTESLNEATIDIAVRMYTSLFPKERLSSVLKNLMMTSASLEAILDFTIVNKSAIHVDNLKHKLILDEWCELERGNRDKVVLLISESLTSYKVKNSLSVLIGILALNMQNSVTELILDTILEKMLDRSILSKPFWLSLVKNIDKTCLGEVCVNHEDFLVSFANFLVYVGSMMEKETLNGEIRWVGNPDISICPEISYGELEAILIFLCQSKHSNVKKYMVNRLSEAQDCTGSSIWEQIRHKCS